MFKNKSIFIILTMVVAFILGTAGITASTFMNTGEKFLTGGYILDPASEEIVTTEVNNQYYFNAGTKYKSRYDQYVEFKDANGEKVSIDTNKFIHYLDGSLSALTKGVILEANTGVISDQVMYYGVSNKTTLVKNGSTYSMNTLDSAKELSEFIWKLSDNTYMVVAPTVTLHLSDSQEITFDDYVQIEYVKEGIVRIVHQNGTYQTVSSEAYLKLPSDVRLNLAGQYFEYDGVEGVSLADMIVDSEANVAVKDNNDSINLPTFNVVNGKDGAPGASGQIGETGEVGEDGQEGTDGADGKNGSNGEAGYEGYDGTDGAMGTDGYEGYTGNTGDNGADGEGGYRGNDGNSAPNSDPSGIVAVKQLAPPTIALDTKTYSVGANSVNMDFDIKDNDNLLTSDLTVTVIDPANPNQVVSSTTITKGTLKGNLSLSNLKANTDYYVIIEGTYDPDNDGADDITGQFFVKQFKTDLLGIGLRKDKVSENAITVAVDFETGSDIKTYSLYAKYLKDDGTEVIIDNQTSVNVVKNSDDTVTYDFTGLDSNKEYTFYLGNVVMGNGSTAAIDESVDIKTLKESPYVVLENNTQIPVTSSSSVVTANEREKTVNVTMHAVGDPDQGVVKYRYELYETNTTDDLNSLTPVQVKETSSLEVVAFNVEANKTYAGRVVVIFDDNEKTVEMETQAPATVAIGADGFPLVSFEKVDAGNDFVEVKVTISDNSRVLLPNINSDYPLVVTFTSNYGDSHRIEITNPASADAVTYTTQFKQRGLRNNTVYSISLTGPVNTDGSKTWENLTPEQRNTFKSTYIGGIQYDTGQKAIIEPVYFDQLGGSNSSAFAIAVNTKAYAAQYNAGVDPVYIAENNTPERVESTFNTLNKMTFELKDNTGKLIGTTSILDKAEPLDTKSEFYEEGYSSDGTSKNPGTTTNLELTPAKFGVADTQLIPGKEYTITLTSVQDYVGNELEFAKSKASYTVQIKENHKMASDPNTQIVVNEITNNNAPTAYQQPDLSLDTVVGFKVEPKYALGDVKKVKYVAYKVTDATLAASIQDDTNITANTFANYGLTQIAEKTFTASDGEAKAPTGDSYLTDFWTVYFDVETEVDGGNKVTFKRGEDYIFRYEVTTSGRYKAACYQGDTDEIYPYCIYKLTAASGIAGGTAVQGDVPFYRSPVYSADRQVPIVQCYPASSTNNSVTWKYRIYDPDGAVALAGPVSVKYKVNSTSDFDSVADKNSVTTSVVNSVNANFVDVNLTGLTNAYYYQMRVEYKLDENSPVESIVSDPILFRGAGNNNTELILNKVIDNGGGEIKFEILGNNIDEYAGVQITVRCDDASLPALSTKEIVFDAVKFADKPHLGDDKMLITGKAEGVAANYRNYNYAYIDATLLPKSWIGKTVTYTIKGYKDTHAEGLGELEGLSNATKIDGLKGSKLTDYSANYYAIYDTKSNQYLTIDNMNSITVSGSTFANDSIVIPGNKKNPFQAIEDQSTDPVTKPYIHLQGIGKEIVAVTDAEKESMFKESDNEVSFDNNGMYMTTNTSARITLKKLSLITVKKYDDTDKWEQKLNDILPSVKEISQSSGVKTVKFDFEFNGDLEKYNTFYVALYEKQDDGTYKQRDLESTVSDGVFYYTALDTSTKTCAPYTVTSADKKTGEMDFLIKNLKKSTSENTQEYFIQLYAKVDNGDGTTSDVLIYDSYHRAQGWQYSFNTGNEVAIGVQVSDLNCNSYTNKYVTIDYKVDGAGMGYTLYYEILDSNDNVVQSAIKLDKKGSVEDLKYYDNVYGRNKLGGATFTPGSSSLVPGRSYKVHIYAVEDNSSDRIGNGYASFTARSLKRPTSKYSLIETKDSIELQYAIEDKDYTIKTNGAISMTVELYNQDGNIVGTSELVTGVDNKIDFTKLYENLTPNTNYRFVVKADVDLNNDGVVDDNVIIDEFTAKTSPDIDADVTAYIKNNQYQIVIYNVKNFDAVKKVKYTIYNESGATINSGVKDNPNPTGEEFASGITKSGSGMQYISAFFYDENDNLVGSSLNMQFHVN